MSEFLLVSALAIYQESAMIFHCVYWYFSICMLEFSGPEIASGFVKENKELKLREQPIAVTKYNTRVVTWEKEKPKNGKAPCFVVRITKC